MSLAAPYQEHYYVADGSTTSFAFGQSFTALNEIDVKCIIYFEDGTNCVPVFNVNMTTGFINIVSLTKPDGTLLTVPPAGSIVRVFRETPEAQNVTASQLQNYTAKQLERVFDSLVAMIQEISYSDIHKTVRLTETQRDIAIDYLPDDKDQAVIYWDVEERKLMPAGFGQNQVVKSDGVEWLVYNQSEGKVYFIPRQGGNPIPIGKATIHNDLSGRNAPDCHPESAITGLREHLQELRDKDSEIEEDVQTALNRSQEAKDTADEAKGTAEYAQTVAGEAKGIAENAKETAEGIEDIAQEAKDTADEAKEIAQDAKDIAEGVVEDIEAVEEGLENHIANKSNPHEVTKAQVGLGNVDNTSDLNKPISTATQTALNGKQATISDLATIRSNAQAGKAASNTIATYGNIVTHNVSEFATAAQGAKADTAIQPSDLGNGTITITQGGITKGTFTTNQGSDATIALDAGGGGGAVDSVNGKTGVVVLTATDVGALPDSTVIPTVNNPTITITQGGVTKGSFTLNQATGDTIALDAGGDAVIDFQLPTAKNNYTWYRKYVSGWVEQGGIKVANTTTVNFPVTMANTNYWYIVKGNYNNQSGSYASSQDYVMTKKTTNMVLSTGGLSVCWQVSGIAAN